jgi:putative ABC transport system substrate-binding protein
MTTVQRLIRSPAGETHPSHSLAITIKSPSAIAGLILKGARPGDLPVDASSRIELIFNLKTARALGLNVPRIILGRADQLIE